MEGRWRGKLMTVVKRYKLPILVTKFWVGDLQHGNYSQRYFIVYLKAAQRVDLKSSRQKGKNFNYVRCIYCTP